MKQQNAIVRMCVVSVLAALLLTGCVIHSNTSGKLERWTTFEGKTVAEMKMGDRQSRVVFMREKGAVEGPAVNIFADRDYVASLLPNGYRAAVVCSQGEMILPSFTRNERFAYRDTGIDYNFTTGETEYVKVVADAAGQPVFQRVPAKEGQTMLATLKKETQTHPRVKANKLCDSAVLEKITIQAHSLFKFDRAAYKDMLPAGRQEIEALGKSIRKQGTIVERVKVVGYTDPVGSDAYNLALSKRRAKTVKQALIKVGVQAEIESQGLGEANLLVRDCSAKHPENRKARMACDQPNRRVEIILYGEEQRYVSVSTEEKM